MSQQEWKSFVGWIIKAYQPVQEVAQRDCLADAFFGLSMVGLLLIIPPIIGCFVKYKQAVASDKVHEEFEQNFKKILANHSTFYESRGISFSQQTEEYTYKEWDDDKERYRSKTGTRRYLVVTVTV